MSEKARFLQTEGVSAKDELTNGPPATLNVAEDQTPDSVEYQSRLQAHELAMDEDEGDYERVSAKRRVFEEGDIERKSGDYLLTYGRAGAGKTVFHWHLFRYLLKSTEYETNLFSDGEDDISKGIVNGAWEKFWSAGVLPPSTVEGTMLEFKVEAKPVFGDRAPLRLGMFELPGEMLARVSEIYDDDVQEHLEGEFDATLNQFLANRRINFRLLYVVNGADPDGADRTLRDLLQFIKDTHPHLVSLPLLIVIANKKAAVKTLVDSKIIKNRYIEDIAETFVMTKMPNAYAYLARGKEYGAAVCFDIGDIKPMDTATKSALTNREGNKGALFRAHELESNCLLPNPKFNDVEKIFDWIYKSYKGRYPNEPTFWQKLRKALHEMFN